MVPHLVVSVVACGPSAIDCGAAKAPGFVIAVNDAFMHVRHDAVLSMDGRWASHRVPTHFNTIHRQRGLYLRRKAIAHVGGYAEGLYRHVHVYDCNREGLLFDSQHIGQGLRLNGPNSGYVALNLAYTMRPKTIYLFGFDHTGGHFHPESEWRQRNEGVANSEGKFRVWADAMHTARQQFDAADITVFNTNNKSAIQAFRYGRP